jgi:O-antigen ligase
VVPQTVLVVVGLWAAWRPCETSTWSAALLAAAALVLLPWALDRTHDAGARAGFSAAVAVALYGGLRALSGWDPATAVGEAGLVIAVAAAIFLASREPPSENTLRWFALGLAALALWAAWQVAAGLELARAAVPDLPPHMQANALERLASGRAFASFVLPSHLAVVLATVLPLLIAGIRKSAAGAASILGCALCVVGLLLTQSPIGIVLAAAAGLAVVAGRRRWPAAAAAAVLACGAVAAFVMRPDLAALEPVRLRLDNWRTAVWVWSTSPVAGVGFGGYGQASQAVPFEVGNHPAHAHSLPLEWAAEFGVVGVLAVILGVLGLATLVRRLWPERRALAVAIVVVPIHNLLDFSLYTSGVAVVWALLVGWGLAADRRPSTGAVAGWLRLAAFAGAAVVVGVTSLHATSVVVQRSAAAQAASRARFDGLVRAHQLAPWRLEPVTMAAIEGLESGDGPTIVAAARLLDDSRALRPASASLAALASRLAAVQGHAPRAVSEAWTAAHAQPFARAHREHLDTLLGRLAEGDDGSGN